MKKCANWITNHSLGITIASLIGRTTKNYRYD